MFQAYTIINCGNAMVKSKTNPTPGLTKIEEDCRTSSCFLDERITSCQSSCMLKEKKKNPQALLLQMLHRGQDHV